jgi:hypothetical protein
MRCSKRLTTTRGCGPSPSRSRIAEQHAVGPREPSARHVDHDIVEVGRHQIKQPRHHVRVEAAHLGRTVRRRNHLKARGVMRQHDFEKLAVKPFRSWLDFFQVQPRFDIEIVGAGAVLEIEIDQADGGADALAAVEQQQRGLDRQGGDPGAANRGNEGVNLRLFGLGDGRARNARAGADELNRLHRLDQEIRHPHLQQASRHFGVEALRDHNHRRRNADLVHHVFQRRHLLGPGRVEIDDGHGDAFGGKIIDAGDGAADDT